MSLSRNPNTTNDLKVAAKRRSKIPEIIDEKTVKKDVDIEKEVKDNKASTKKKEDVEKKAKTTTQKTKPKKTKTKEVVTEEVQVDKTPEPELIIPPRSQVRVPAYSMAKIRAIMEIKGIRYSHEVIDYLITVVEDKIFTKTEKELYDTQMDFQRMKFENNGWDTEK